MTRKPKAKHPPGLRYPDSIRREARKIYLTEGASDREIAERVGVSRANTIKAWRTKEGWAKDRLEAAEKAAVKTIEKIADTEAEVNARHTKLFKHLEALGTAYLADHYDPATKSFKVPDAKDFRAMTAALRDIQQGTRLALGLPDKVTETRTRGVEFPDYPKMTEAEVMRLAGYGEDNECGEPTVAEAGAPTNGSGRLTH